MKEKLTFDKNLCPHCGSSQFETEPNQYDIVEFHNGYFEIIRTEISMDEHIFLCSECYKQIDFEATIDEGRIILKQDEQGN